MKPEKKRKLKPPRRPEKRSPLSPQPSPKPAAGPKKVTPPQDEVLAAATAKPVKHVARKGKQPVSVAKTTKRALRIPPILLEGDLPHAPKLAGPGGRYALGPAITGSPVVTGRELPEGYGTRRLFLAARDPRWLYASWDLTPEQQQEFNRLSRDGHMILRVFANDDSAPVVPEVHVNPESRSWFINVPKPETRYQAQLGFHDAFGKWVLVSTSPHTFTPPDAPSVEVAVEFATIPVQVTFEQVVESVQEFVTEHRPLLDAVAAAQEAQHSLPVAPLSTAPSAELRTAQTGGQPATVRNRRGESPAEPLRRRSQPQIPIQVTAGEPWTPERRQALARLINIDAYRRVWMGSIEITELVRRHLQEEISSLAAAELARAAVGGAPAVLADDFRAVSSPSGGQPPKAKSFWFKVNAELIIYGATEPDAHVRIAERPVKLRSDGTFSFRFALPDGQYNLPAIALSADGAEGRTAILEFSRSTEYHGHVEPHPQDPRLRAPRAENL